MRGSAILTSISEWWAGLQLTGTVGGLIAAAVATIVLLVALRLVRALFVRIEGRVQEWEGTRIHALRFQRQEILSADEIVHLAVGMLKVMRLGIAAVLLLAYLSVVFSFFPWTRGVAVQALEYVLTALQVAGTAIAGYLPSLALIIVIALITTYLIRLAQLVFNGIRSGRIRIRGFYPEWATPTFNILRIFAITFAVVMVFPLLPGSESPAFRGMSIFFALLLSLGSTAAVANVVAGIVITYTRAFQTGDRVRIADTEGDVVEKTMFVTRVRTPKNVEIAIPNSMVLANHIINYSAQARKLGLVLHTTVTIGYDVPWPKVHELLIQAAMDTENVEEDPAPFVLQTSLDDFYVSYELNAHTHRPRRMNATYSELHSHIQDRFHSAGVEIASPHYSAIRDGSGAAMPDQYLPQDYQPPPFRIHPWEKSIPRKPEKKDALSDNRHGVESDDEKRG